MNERILETAKKLKTLSDRGVDGEKENAIDMLKRFMAKYSITIEMIEGRIIKSHSIFLEPKTEKQFFKQIASNVLGQKFDMYLYRYKQAKLKDKKRYGIDCTDAEFIEIQAKHEFYYRHYTEELHIFHSAFIQTNGIWAKSNGEEKEEKPLSEKERQDLLKIMAMMEGMDRKVFNKQLA